MQWLCGGDEMTHRMFSYIFICEVSCFLLKNTTVQELVRIKVRLHSYFYIFEWIWHEIILDCSGSSQEGGLNDRDISKVFMK